MKVTDSDKKVSLALQGIAAGLDECIEELIGKRQAFCLIVFSDEKEGISRYVCNCKHEDTVIGLEKLPERIKAGPPIPAHKIN